MRPLHMPTHVADILQEHGMFTRKRLGQNFLVDANILRKIIDAAELKPDDRVIEIGAGLGILSRELAAHAGHVVAIETDSRCVEVLRETTEGLVNLELIHADALVLDLATLAHGNSGSMRAKIVSNLPYGISKAILHRLFDARAYIESAVLMLQKEVAERVIAQPSTRAYGPLAVAADAFADVDVVATVSPNSFFPPPRVRSAILRIRFVHPPRVPVDDERFYFKVVTASLRERRKTLFNSLSSGLSEFSRDCIRQALREASIEEGRRGETLSALEFAQISRALARAKNGG